MTFSIKEFCSICGHYLLKKSLMKNLFFVHWSNLFIKPKSNRTMDRLGQLTSSKNNLLKKDSSFQTTWNDFLPVIMSMRFVMRVVDRKPYSLLSFYWSCYILAYVSIQNYLMHLRIPNIRRIKLNMNQGKDVFPF